MDVDRALSATIRRRIKAKSKGCFYNAWQALGELPAALYVEGWTVTRDSAIAIEHAWLEYDGRIVDPTLGHDLDIAAYFPGLRLTGPELAEALGKGQGQLPIAPTLANQPPEYRQAFQDALALCSKLLGLS